MICSVSVCLNDEMLEHSNRKRAYVCNKAKKRKGWFTSKLVAEHRNIQPRVRV